MAAAPKGEPPVAASDAQVVVTADDLRIWFPIKAGFFRRTIGHIKAVDGVSLQLRAGQTLGVVGESGSGKTTLGLALLRLISSKGPIVVLGRRIDGLDSRAMRPLRRDVQAVFQDPYGSLSPRMTVADIVGEGLSVHEPSLTTDARDARVVEALVEVGLGSGDAPPLSARIFRRPAPAHRHCPRYGAEAEIRHAR